MAKRAPKPWSAEQRCNDSAQASIGVQGGGAMSLPAMLARRWHGHSTVGHTMTQRQEKISLTGM